MISDLKAEPSILNHFIINDLDSNPGSDSAPVHPPGWYEMGDHEFTRILTDFTCFTGIFLESSTTVGLLSFALVYTPMIAPDRYLGSIVYKK